jgi:GT2 family glycosyltransferase
MKEPHTVMKLVSINLLGYNDKRYIYKCINSILNQTYRNTEITFIDNHSSDHSAEYVEDNFPEVKVVRYQDDPDAGYAKVHNFGIKLARGDYILIMNVDIFLEPNAIEELVKALENSTKNGSASGKVYQSDENFDKTNRFDTTGITLTKDRRVPDRGWGEEDYGQYDDPEQIFSPTGALTIYSRDMLEDLKVFDEYFDEDFISYREESDLNWRGKLMGWFSVYVPTSIAYHDRTYSKSTRKNQPRNMRRLVFRNRYLMIIKNDTVANLLRHLPNLLLFEFMAFFYALLREQFLITTYLEVIRLTPKMLKKRREIMKRKVVSNSEILRYFR